jgi:hypothetical protein
MRVLLDEGDLDGVLSVGFDGDGHLNLYGAPDVKTLDRMWFESGGFDLQLGRFQNVGYVFTSAINDFRLDLNRVDYYLFARVREGELIMSGMGGYFEMVGNQVDRSTNLPKVS